MAQALAMVHATDPKAEIMREIEPFLADVQPLGTEVLLAVYVRPERMASGLYLPQNKGPMAEDRFQGKTGLVLAMGAMAFAEDATHRWGGVIPKVGDWVAINVGDTWAFELGTRRCRVVEDVDVKLLLQRPDIVW